MPSSKELIAFAAMVAGTSLFAGGEGEDFAKWVDPFIGSAGTGNTFPGACRPFGLVQASPDVKKLTPSGYTADCDEIVGFSNTHLNGTGNPALGDVRLMPFVGELHADDVYFDRLVRESESATSGYYAVRLADADVLVEATATERIGIWRFTYDREKPARMLFDPVSSLCLGWSRKWGPNVVSAEMSISSDGREIRGGRHVKEWADREMFYCARFDRPFKVLRRISKNPFEGAGERLVLGFDLGKGETVEVRVAISTVSAEGAAKAFARESDGKTFAQIRTETRAKWNELLSRAQLVKGTDEQKKNWYVALYHLFIQPNDITDVDGCYRGADGKVAKAPCGSYYSTLSLWDTFRAAHPLYTILVPERVDGFLETMIAHGRAHGHLPIWTLWGKEIHDMIGVHSIPVIVDAFQKGFRNFDTAEALDLMVRSLTDATVCEKRNDWNVFWENGGYYPYRKGEWDENWKPMGSVSRTLEIAYDWWCVAEFAKAIGNARAAADAAERAAAWRKVFDEKTGFMRGRGPSYMGGEWREPFDPRWYRAPGEFHGDYTEGNAWQYTWHVFQEPDALAALMGGRASAVAKLDEMFSTPPLRPMNISANNDEGGVDGMRGQFGQYWHGNEPSHHIAYLYAAYGAPEKAAAAIRRIWSESYRPSRDGICGNEDCGQMSAWYLFSMMGFYPVNPCGDGYVLCEAQADEIKLRVGEGKTFRIVGGEVGVQSSSSRKDEKFHSPAFAKAMAGKPTPTKNSNLNINLNGKKVDGVKISHKDIMRGGTLEF